MIKSKKFKSVRLRVSPAANKLAEELGIDLTSLRGSGSLGRIVVADIQQAQLSSNSENSKKTAYRQKVSLPTADMRGESVKIRRLLARKMEKAWQEIPHFYVTVSVDMTDVVRFRHDLGVTINDFIIAATAQSLVEHPWVNAAWNGEQGVELEDINIAIAAATDRGLFYPVLLQCETLSLQEISKQVRELVDKIMLQDQLTEQDNSDATFTITNMGMLGVESFSAIITPPQAAVLCVGTIKGEVVVDDQGEPAVAPIMRLSLSADHRLLDGFDAAEFLNTIKCYLEAPIMLIQN
ncbi:MAG: dihydrolipoamide acetyltransferase family protein [Desulfuromusa sp.]|nr:dihydrolipoamide acetyltransferase family protein [Desulfuromusa sp.]